MMPVVFIGHGSPTNALEENRFVRGWERIAESLPRPSSILSISAHWFVREVRACGVSRPKTIHDFYGFPSRMYELEYPAPGDPPLAAGVTSLLSEFECVTDDAWGLDHGTWCPLMRMYPEADIPVVQLSVDRLRPAADHYAMGRALAPLREEGVLIMGSGNIVHDLRNISWETPEGGEPWAESFRERTGRMIRERDDQGLIELAAWSSDSAEARDEAQRAIPTPDHYLPLLYALGASQGDSTEIHNDSCVYGSVSMTSVVMRQPA